MANMTRVAIEVFLPTTSMARVNDFVVLVLDKAVTEHRGLYPHVAIQGPFSGGFVPEHMRGENATLGNVPARPARGADGSGGGHGVERSPRGQADDRAREDFADEGAERDDEGTGVEQGRSGGGEAPADAPKRRGRPPGSRNKRDGDGSPEASGKAAEGSERSGRRAAGSGSTAEGDRRHEPRGTDQGAVQGGGKGEGGARGTEPDRGAKRGDPEAARVADDWNSPEDDAADPAALSTDLDWAKKPGDDWPDHLTPYEEIDEAAIMELLSKHFEASGDRKATYAVMERMTGEKVLKNVHPDDFDKLARALMKDTACIKHGVKR